MSTIKEKTWTDAAEMMGRICENLYNIYVCADELAVTHRTPDILAREKRRRRHFRIEEPYNSLTEVASKIDLEGTRLALTLQARAQSQVRI